MSSGFQLRDFNYFFQYTKPTQVKYQGYFETLRQVEKGKILFILNTGKEKPQSIKITSLGRFCKLSNNNEQRISVPTFPFGFDKMNFHFSGDLFYLKDF